MAVSQEQDVGVFRGAVLVVGGGAVGGDAGVGLVCWDGLQRLGDGFQVAAEDFGEQGVEVDEMPA